MSANISTYSFPQMTDLVKRSFEKRVETLPQEMRNSGLVMEETIPQQTWEYKRYAERIHRNQYASYRAEWAVSSEALVQYGYEKDLAVYTVSLEVSITKRMRVAGKDQDILDQITSLSDVCPATIDLDLSHRITFATSTSYTDRDWRTVDITVWDSLALISASHTLTGSSTTYSNVITWNPQFSKWSLEVAERSFVENSFNNLGEKIVVRPNVIFTTDDPTTINLVKELLRATANVDTNNSGTFNVYESKYTHVILPRVATTAAGFVDSTKKKYWGLASTEYSDMHLAILEQPYLKTPTEGNNWENFSSENWTYLTAATYGIATVTGRWIRLSTGLWV